LSINEEDRLGQEIGSIRRRLSKLDQLSSSVGEYDTTLTSQEDRLQGVGWFQEKLRDMHECPVCAAVHMVRERLKPVSQAVFKPSAPPDAGLDKQ
jgi:hypothetical protein